MRKFLLYSGGIFVFIAILLQTPFFEHKSKIILSSDESANCLKIKEHREGDVSISRFGIGKVRFLEFETNTYIKGSISGLTYKKEDNFTNIQNEALTDIKACGAIKYSDDLFLLKRGKEKCSNNDFRSSIADNFYIVNDKELLLLQCSISKRTGEYLPNCNFRSSISKNWEAKIFLPSKNITNWKAVLQAAKNRFQRTLEPLSYCPVRIPFL